MQKRNLAITNIYDSVLNQEETWLSVNQLTEIILNSCHSVLSHKRTDKAWSKLKFWTLIQYYSMLYPLKRIKNRISVTAEGLACAKKGRIFIVVVLVNTKGEIYYRLSFNHLSGWELPGGFVKDSDFSLESATLRIVNNESGLKIDELRPLAVMENNFIFKNYYYTQYGIAFLALARNQQSSYENNHVFGNFMDCAQSNIVSTDRKLVECAKKHLKENKLCPPVNEVDESSSLGWRYTVHNNLVRPVQKVLSSRPLCNAIKNNIIGQTFLDVSCGDDSLITQWSNSHPECLCIANDISWFSMSRLIERVRFSNTIFTNHDARHLPYRKPFDTVLFKNTLHHFNYSAADDLIKRFLRITKQRLIIVDVEDPTKTNLSHRFWNKYYIKFLHDQGNQFWSFEQFQKLIDQLAPKAKFYRIKTNRGNYMMAICDKHYDNMKGLDEKREHRN